MARLKDLIVNIGVGTKDLNRDLGKARAKFSRNFGNIQRMAAKTGRAMSVAFTAPLMAIGAKSVKTFKDFELQMAKVKAVSGATGAEFAALKANAERLGRETKFTASEVAELSLNYAKLGFSAGEIQNVTEATLKLAQATDSDLAQAAEVAGATLRGFGMDTKQTTHLTDVMAASFSNSAMDMDSFSESMKYVAPVAASAGMSVEKTTAMLALLSNAGIRGSAAGTALRRIISELGATGGDVEGAIRDLAAGGLNLADAKDEVGRSAQSALLVLSKQLDKLPGLTKEYENADGAAAKMAKTMENTLQGRLDKLNSALEGVGLQIGEALLPLVTQLTEHITKAAAYFSNLSKETQEMVLIGAGLLAVVGPLVSMFASLAPVIALLSAPVLAVAAAVAIFVGGVGSLVYKINKARNAEAEMRAELKRAEEQYRANIKAVEDYHKSVDQTATTEQKLADLTLPNVEQALGRVNGSVKGFAKHMKLAIGQKDLDRIKELEESYKGVELFGVTPLEAALGDYRAELKKTAKAEADAAGSGSGTTTKRRGADMTPIKPKGVQLVTRATTAMKALIVPAEELEQKWQDQQFLKWAQAYNERLWAIQDTAKQVAMAVGSSFGTAMAKVVQGTEKGREALKGFAREAIQTALAASQAHIIEAMIASGKFTGPAAPFTIPLLVASGISLVSGLFNEIPQFAAGGIVSGPVAGIMGEYPGARTNPEVIAPLDKLQKMMGGTNVTGNIRGRDLVLVQERASYSRRRKFGK